MAELLALEDVSAGYGAAVVVDRVSLSLGQGETLAVLGRNGMGKTTLLKTIVGLTALQHGTVRWLGADWRSVPVHGRAGAGLGWVPQERGMFASLTVEEHLTAVARPGAWDVERVYRLFPRLA